MPGGSPPTSAARRRSRAPSPRSTAPSARSTSSSSHPPTRARHPSTSSASRAGLRNWTLDLYEALAEKGVYVAHVGITALIGSGHPDAEPDVIARAYVKLHDERKDAELHHVAYDG